MSGGDLYVDKFFEQPLPSALPASNRDGVPRPMVDQVDMAIAAAVRSA